MTEGTYNKQKPCPHTAKLQEKSANKEMERINEADKKVPETERMNAKNLIAVEKELELTKTITEEALKKIETLSQENAELRKKIRLIEKLQNRYEHLDGYMEKYGFNSDLEREMWQTIRQVIKKE